MVRTTWIYSLRKEDLITYVTELRLDATGNVEDLRKRLANFVMEQLYDIADEQLLETWEAKHNKLSPAGSKVNLNVENDGNEGEQKELQTLLITSPNSDQQRTHTGAYRKTITPGTLAAATQNTASTVPNTSTHNYVADTSYDNKKNYAAVIDVVRKWPIRYDGERSLLVFVERLEELADVYDIDVNTLPRTMPELLKDKALSWYRNNNQRWTTWLSFKASLLQFFLLPRYCEQLDDQIRRRVQGPREAFSDVVLAIQELMRHTTYDEDKKLERIYRNARQDIQTYILRQDFNRLEELSSLAGEYELSKQQEGIPTTIQQPHHKQVTDIAKEHKHKKL